MLTRRVDRNDALTGTITTAKTPPIDVSRAKTYAIQCVVDVDVPSAEEFSSGVQATLTDQSLTYTAVAKGAAGNSITIELIDPGGTTPLSVAVVGSTRIQVTLETLVGAIVSTGNDVKAAINADSPGAADLVLVTGTNGSLVTALAETPLADGADTDVEANGADTVQIPAHDLTTGLKGQLTTDMADLPSGLSTGVDLFVIVVDANNVKFATSLANALVGTAITIADDGNGTHTFTPTALAGASVKLEKSNHPDALSDPDSAAWSDVAAATSITADGTVWFEGVDPGMRALRLSYTLTAGQLQSANYVLVKE